eukprot:6193583-Pleurochrysis_carterae.AAC.1
MPPTVCKASASAARAALASDVRQSAADYVAGCSLYSVRQSNSFTVRSRTRCGSVCSAFGRPGSCISAAGGTDYGADCGGCGPALLVTFDATAVLNASISCCIWRSRPRACSAARRSAAKAADVAPG